MMKPLPARTLGDGRRDALDRRADNQPVRSPNIPHPPPGGAVEVLELFPRAPADGTLARRLQ